MKKKAGNKKDNKATKVEFERRVRTVCELLLKGYSRSKIIQYITENSQRKVQERQIDNYIKSANEIIKKDFEESSEKGRITAVVFNRMQEIYELAEENEDIMNMRGVLKDLRDFLGLDNSGNIEGATNESNGTGTPNIEIVFKKFDNE